MAQARKFASTPKPRPVLQLDWEPADAGAVKALIRGEADEHQQRRALKWIVEEAAGTNQIAYRAGHEGERDTAFMEGRHFVAASITDLVRKVIPNDRGDGNA